MAEHEPVDIADKDTTRASNANVHSDDAAISSEPMDLQRLPEPTGQVSPGRQRTGDPPAPRPPSGEAG